MDDPPVGDLVGRMITLSGLLAGFSFTALIELITLADGRPIIGFTVAFSLLGAALYIIALFGFVASTSIPLRNEQAKSTAASIELAAFFIFWLATLGLLATIALAGWVYSTAIGIVGTVVAAIALVVLVALLVVRGRVL
ncbi:MAG TPA: hypothetical protein VK879_14305 [Candidatus Sulfomarinibacteraceae bacterium]|nr:hypothetical protein [Candidatus Sulfomarinibacteraceae bacterium]